MLFEKRIKGARESIGIGKDFAVGIIKKEKAKKATKEVWSQLGVRKM